MEAVITTEDLRKSFRGRKATVEAVPVRHTRENSTWLLRAKVSGPLEGRAWFL